MSEKEQKNEEPSDEKGEAPAEPADQNAQLRDRLLRLAAEFDNYKKRVAKDLDSSKELGRSEVVAKLLPTIDEFELAMRAFEKDDEHMKGMALIFSNLMSTLKGFGLREIDVTGKFDPYKHEIVLVRESEKDDGEIIEVVRKGYTMNNVMLRPASVIVSKPESGKEKTKGE